MKYLVFTFLLSLGWIWSSAQATDSTGRMADSTGRKLSIFQRRRLEMTQMMELRRQRVAERQRERPSRKGDSARWILSFNPFGVLELQGALGLGIGYYISPHWQVWSETSELFQLIPGQHQSCLGGIREILAVKYYFGYRQTFFVAGEFRYKDVHYHDVADFNGYANFPSVNNYTYSLKNVIFGGAGWFGARINISDNHRWRLEPSLGFGLKGRTVVWHGVPAGYQYKGEDWQHEILDDTPRTPARLTPYVPASLRLVYAL